MNAGLVTLANWLIHAGDDKERNKEYNRRQQAEDLNRRALYDYERSVARADKLDERRYQEIKEAKKAETDKENLRQGATAMAYLAKTQTPWNDLKPNHQAAIVAYYGNDPDKAAAGYEAMRQNLVQAKTTADYNKAIADQATEMNRALAADATREMVAPNAVSKMSLDTATNRGGGVIPATRIKDENLVTVNPDSSQTIVRNPMFKTDAQKAVDEAKEMAYTAANANNKTGKSPLEQAGFPTKTVGTIDAAGNPIVVPATRWNAQAAESTNRKPYIKMPGYNDAENDRINEIISGMGDKARIGQSEQPTDDEDLQKEDLRKAYMLYGR